MRRRVLVVAALGAAVALAGVALPVAVAASTAQDAVVSLHRGPGGGMTKPIVGVGRGFNVGAVDQAQAGVAGVVLTGRVVAGPNAPSADSAGAAVTCSSTRSDGGASCGFTPRRAGTDTIRVHVDQSGGSSGVHDPREPFLDATFSTEPAPNTNPAEARVLVMDPESTSFSSRADTFRGYLAIVRDRTGLAVQGVEVTFTEEGAGALDGRAPSHTGVTDDFGRALVLAGSYGESGTQVITGRITTPGTECDRVAGDPEGAPPGACADTSTVTYGAEGGPTPPGSPSPSPSPTPVTHEDCMGGAFVAVPGTDGFSGRTTTITAGQALTVEVSPVRGARPGRVVELFARTRPDMTEVLVRVGTTDDRGVATFAVRPPRNTVLRGEVQEDECRYRLGSAPALSVEVATALSLSADRNGRLDYTFRGRAMPARPGQVVSLHRRTADGREVLTSRARVGTDGTWTVDRRFQGSGRFPFVARTAASADNAAGVSDARPTVVH
jgi:hypothetical protein